MYMYMKMKVSFYTCGLVRRSVISNIFFIYIAINGTIDKRYRVKKYFQWLHMQIGPQLNDFFCRPIIGMSNGPMGKKGDVPSMGCLMGPLKRRGILTSVFHKLLVSIIIYYCFQITITI
jgi:hypothetical protein